MKFRVSYVAYEGQGSTVLSEGEMDVEATTSTMAENQVKAMMGFPMNRVLIRSVFNA